MSDNPFELEGEDEGSGAVGNSTIQEMRKALERKEKAEKAAQKRIEELEAFQNEVLAERRGKAVTSAFEAVGLAPEHAELFRAVNPSLDAEAITAEAAAQFAAQYKLPTQTTGEPPASPEPAPVGYNPVTTGSAAPLAMLTEDDVEELIKRGEYETVSRARKEGRIVRESVPWRTLPGDERQGHKTGWGESIELNKE